MIVFISGQPGNGKTLYTLAMVEKRRQAEGRPVFYHGIPELTLPWVRLDDPKAWNACPEGAIIVIDECQRIFPPRGSASAVPDHVRPMETHRHKGYDLYLLSQCPTLVDNHIKKLAGRHIHLMRYFGLQQATVFEMQVVLSPITNTGLKQAVRSRFKYPKDVFKWYKSAEQHTHKRKLPAKVLAIPLLLLAIIGLGYWSYYVLVAKRHDLPAGVSQGGSAQASGSIGGKAAPMTPGAYLDTYRPRIADLPYTAPAYDEVTRPADAPYPAGCVKDRHGCRCFTQQATKMAVSEFLCKELMDGGFFRAWRSKEEAPAMRMGAAK